MTSDPANTISEDTFRTHIEVLASDEFEGRSPSSAGEEKTMEYLQTEFQQLGLEPGNGGNYLQDVPLIEMRSDYNEQMTIRGTDETLELEYTEDFMAISLHMEEDVALHESELVFAGFGIVAPEYDWNDYENLDVEGKTVIVLVNDPGYETNDDSLFNGKAMTYYGRWTYKYEEAARQGAAGVIIVHEVGAAGYPWGVVRNSWSGPQFYLEAGDNYASRPTLEAWITTEAALRIFDQAGLDFATEKQKATQQRFKPKVLGSRVSYALKNRYEQTVSHNFLALWPGDDRPDEYIVYMGHWDHFGVDTSNGNREIYNGARDNATGVAGLLEVARAYTELPERQSRSILFLAVTAEERGLLGSKYYASHPVYPEHKTVAAINMDALNIWGPTKDITITGYGNSELDDVVEDVAEAQDRYVRPDPEPEKGGYYRSDHFSFAREGVPALAASFGVDHAEHGEEWMLDQINDWNAENYHKPSDEYLPDEWDLSGAIQDLRMYFHVGLKLANSSDFPNWREGTEFRAKRDEDMGS